MWDVNGSGKANDTHKLICRYLIDDEKLHDKKQEATACSAIRFPSRTTLTASQIYVPSPNQEFFYFDFMEQVNPSLSTLTVRDCIY
jgi:hypothetical protein